MACMFFQIIFKLYVECYVSMLLYYMLIRDLANTFLNVANHHDLYTGTIFFNIYIYKKRQKQENILHDAGHYM